MTLKAGYILFIVSLCLSIISFITRKNKTEKLNSFFLAVGMTFLIFELFKSDARIIKLECLTLLFVFIHFSFSRLNLFKTHMFSFLCVSITSLIFLFIGGKPFAFMGSSISFHSWSMVFIPLLGVSIWYFSELTANIFSQFVGFETKKSLEQVTHLFFFALAVILASFMGTMFGVFLVGISYLSSSFYRNDNSSNIAFAFLLLPLISFFSHKFSITTLDFMVMKNVAGLCLGIAGVWFLQILSKSKSNALVFSLIGIVFYLFSAALLLFIGSQKNALGGLDAYVSLLIGTSIGLVSFYNFSLTHILFSSLFLLGLTIAPYTLNDKAVDQKKGLYKGVGSNAKERGTKKTIFEVKGLSLNEVIGNYKIDASSSLLSFQLGQKGDLTSGAINSFSGKIKITNNIVDSKFNISLPVDNLTTFNDLRDESLMNQEYFNRETFSKMKYVSSGLTKKADFYELTGEFLMLGVKKPLSVRIKYIGQEKVNGKNRPVIVGESSLDRTLFGMTPSAMEGDVVDFEFRIELIEI